MTALLTVGAVCLFVGFVAFPFVVYWFVRRDERAAEPKPLHEHAESRGPIHVTH